MYILVVYFIFWESVGVCSRVYGYMYIVNIIVVGDEFDDFGFFVNFSVFKKLVYGNYDYMFLNDYEDFF